MKPNPRTKRLLKEIFGGTEDPPDLSPSKNPFDYGDCPVCKQPYYRESNESATSAAMLRCGCTLNDIFYRDDKCTVKPPVWNVF